MRVLTKLPSHKVVEPPIRSYRLDMQTRRLYEAEVRDQLGTAALSTVVHEQNCPEKQWKAACEVLGTVLAEMRCGEYDNYDYGLRLVPLAAKLGHNAIAVVAASAIPLGYDWRQQLDDCHFSGVIRADYALGEPHFIWPNY